MKILVVIANYGIGHEVYLERLVEEYQSMPYDVDVQVLSNIPKDVPLGASVIVGLPTRNPWSLPHGHKPVFARHVNDYDLFIYSEDDHLISRRNIEAFLKISDALPEDEIPGFLVSEHDQNGKLSFCAMHGPFRWDPASVRKRANYTFAFLTNEHSACYLVTQRQLKRAIKSGGFLVEPHDGKYDLACTASTDIYTQCGFKKLICISHLDDFLVPHLPNKYVGEYGMREEDLKLQIPALLEISEGIRPAQTLFSPETRLKGTPWSKDYYEPVRQDILGLISSEARSILSVGCGLGETEAFLARRGVRVVGVPADSVVSVSAHARGISVVQADFAAAFSTLSGERFDCVLFSGVLHLLPDPVSILKAFAKFMADSGTIIVTVPNHSYLGVWRLRMRRGPCLASFGDYERTGTHLVTRRVIRRWLRKSGFAVKTIEGPVPARFRRFGKWAFGFFRAVIESDLLVVAKPRSEAPQPFGIQRVARLPWLTD